MATSVVLIGFKSCGKTTIGKLLAKATGLAFTDLDTVLERHYAAAHPGAPLGCRAIFLKHGEAAFRQLEGEALGQLAGHAGIVLATGGGAPLHPANRPLLKQLGKVVYLQASPSVIYQRFRANGMPAFLKHDPTLAGLTAIWEQRHPIYQELADVTIPVDGVTPLAASAAVFNALAPQG